MPGGPSPPDPKGMPFRAVTLAPRPLRDPFLLGISIRPVHSTGPPMGGIDLVIQANQCAMLIMPSSRISVDLLFLRGIRLEGPQHIVRRQFGQSTHKLPRTFFGVAIGEGSEGTLLHSS